MWTRKVFDTDKYDAFSKISGYVWTVPYDLYVYNLKLNEISEIVAEHTNDLLTDTLHYIKSLITTKR